VVGVLPSIVIVDAESAAERDEDGNLISKVSLGSGIILDAEGFVLTNEHVIRGAETIMVILADQSRHEAELVGHDAPFTDIAVLRITPTGQRAPRFGSSAALDLGDAVFTAGNPLLGVRPTVTLGIVSDPDASFPRDNFVQEHLIQTDAALNQGNSGGALVNLAGEIVGLTTTVVRQTDDGSFVDGVAFALQMDIVLPIARAIARDGRFPRADFGVLDVRSLNPLVAGQLGLSVDEGAFLVEITREGVFGLAGLRPGDIVVSMNGMAITRDQPYLNALRQLQPNQAVEVVYLALGMEPQESLILTPEVRRR
jgi:S1-C subfamily serine protease